MSRKRRRPTAKDKRRLAAKMRSRPTQAELDLALALLARQPRFRLERQYIRLGYIADMAFPELQIIVECDGAIHDMRKRYDDHRNEVFRKRGWLVLRYRNERIASELEEVCDEIMEHVELRAGLDMSVVRHLASLSNPPGASCET